MGAQVEQEPCQGQSLNWEFRVVVVYSTPLSVLIRFFGTSHAIF